MDIIFNPNKQTIKKGTKPNEGEKHYQIPSKGVHYLFIELIPSWGSGDYYLRISNTNEWSDIPKKTYQITDGQIVRLDPTPATKPLGSMGYTSFRFRSQTL